MLKRVAFTGADDFTVVDDLLRLSGEYEWIEWGILLPPKGRGRMPSTRWLRELIGAQILAPTEMQLSGHVCPPWTAELINGKPILDFVGLAFKRIQVNTHADHYSWPEGWLERFAIDFDREYILQLDGKTGTDAFAEACLAGEDADNITGLFDLSHGAGRAPESWPTHFTSKWIGYAGGLGPHNLADQIPAILRAAGDADIWIDMETYVRTDERFDLAKVRQCIEIAAPFIGRPAP